MNDVERQLLNNEVERLAARVAALEAALRAVVDKARHVPVAEEVGRVAGVSVVMDAREWERDVVGVLGDAPASTPPPPAAPARAPLPGQLDLFAPTGGEGTPP